MLHKKFNKWTIIEILGSRKGKTWCKAMCNCGTIREYRISDLKYKGLQGCNKCRKNPNFDNDGYKFDRYTFQSWQNMNSRCNNINHKSYKSYGAKGIKVCDSWLEFKQFTLDMGLRPKGTVIDRIDPLKGYEKSNCRWITPEENIKRMTRKVSYKLICGCTCPVHS